MHLASRGNALSTKTIFCHCKLDLAIIQFFKKMNFETQEKENKCNIICKIIIHSRKNLKKKTILME